MRDEKKLTMKQIRAIPKIIIAKNYDQGCKDAKISRSAFYKWMQDEYFAAEFHRQQVEIAEVALGMLSQNMERAVGVLVKILDSSDDRVKRLAANDIINHFLKHTGPNEEVLLGEPILTPAEIARQMDEATISRKPPAKDS